MDLVCKVCGYEKAKSFRGLSAHIFQAHTEYKCNLKAYYDKYIDSSFHKCKYCESEAVFESLSVGYRITCKNKKCSKKLERDTRISLYGKFESDSSIERGLIKQEETMLDKYGIRHNLCNGPLREAALDKIEEKYGSRNYNNSEKMVTTKKNWSNEKKLEMHLKLSIANKLSHNEEVNRRIQEKRKLSVDSWSKKISEKLRSHTVDKERDIAKRRRKKYCFNGIYFDSKSEIEVWKYCTENNIKIIHNPLAFQYIDKYGNSHKYIPDFSINGILYEIKGNHLWKNGELYFPYRGNTSILEKMDARDHAKTLCMREHSVRVILSEDIVKYGVERCLYDKFH